MNLLVLTSSALRHRALIGRLAQIATVRAVLEGLRPLIDDVGSARQHMSRRVALAERLCFPVQTSGPFPMTMAYVPWHQLEIPIEWIREADRIIVYGTSLIKDPLYSAIQDKAINLHAGWAPQYRGSHSNFWALYDGHPEYVGMTIQTLDKDVDAGAIWHQVGTQPEADPFLYGMKTIKAGFEVLAQELSRAWTWPAPKAQDISQLIRYSRHADYTEEVARAFLDKYHITS